MIRHFFELFISGFESRQQRKQQSGMKNNKHGVSVGGPIFSQIYFHILQISYKKGVRICMYACIKIHLNTQEGKHRLGDDSHFFCTKREASFQNFYGQRRCLASRDRWPLVAAVLPLGPSTSGAGNRGTGERRNFRAS
jgi:hypothetical protein